MPFGLQIGTERASALQQSVQDELMKRGYSSEADPVMAEYITIMIINNKTAPQITVELQDLIGSEYEASFTDWLFSEAATDPAGSSATTQLPAPSTSTQPEPAAAEPAPSRSPEQSKRAPNAPSRGFTQAVTQANSSSSGQKRTASARSPSPSQPNKTRRTDLPTGPRAMHHRDGNQQQGRTLLERMGRPGRHTNNNAGPPHNGHSNDEVQRRINDIVNNPSHGGMVPPGNLPPGMGMDMAMGNPMVLQEMMMNQMALMAHVANTMGMLPGAQQFNGAGFPMQGMPGDMGGFPNAQGGMGHHGDGGARGRGRGAGRGGNMRGRGRGGVPNAQSPVPAVEAPAPAPAAVAAPIPQQAVIAPVTSPAPARVAYVLPERPQSPTLCKFGVKCTNAQCRWSHPSPVATGESGIVLSNDACEKGKGCKDADCIKAHVSPAVLKPQPAVPEPTQHVAPAAVPAAPQHTPATVPCRFGANCSRSNCTYSHPERNSHFAQQCRFGANCTRAACPFQHPEGRVLPSSFHRGLSTTSPVVSVPKPEAGTMGGPSHHRSAVFNKNSAGNATLQSKLAQQIKEIEEKKKEVEKAEAAAGKKEENSSIPIAT